MPPKKAAEPEVEEPEEDPEVEDPNEDLNEERLPPEDIHMATRAGDLEAVKEFVKNGVDPNLVGGGWWRYTPVHLAASRGDLHVVNYLISMRVDLDVQDGDLETALHKAAIRGRAEVYKALVAAGANEDIKNRDGKPPSFYARLTMTKAELGA